MKWDELTAFIEIEHTRLQNNHFGLRDQKEEALARAVKLGEEVGELCNEVLAHLTLQRKDKLQGRKQEALSHEFADVILTTLLLAKTLEVNIPDAIRSKIMKVNRWYSEQIEYSK